MKHLQKFALCWSESHHVLKSHNQQNTLLMHKAIKLEISCKELLWNFCKLANRVVHCFLLFNLNFFARGKEADTKKTETSRENLHLLIYSPLRVYNGQDWPQSKLELGNQSRSSMSMAETQTLESVSVTFQ